ASQEQERHESCRQAAQKGAETPPGRAAVALMIGLDTNVLVRFLVRDDEAQVERARRLLKRETGSGEAVMLSLLVLLETEWVLRSRYGLTKDEIFGAFSGLLDSVELYFEDEGSLEQALFVWKDTRA